MRISLTFERFRKLMREFRNFATPILFETFRRVSKVVECALGAARFGSIPGLPKVSKGFETFRNFRESRDRPEPGRSESTLNNFRNPSKGFEQDRCCKVSKLTHQLSKPFESQRDSHVERLLSKGLNLSKVGVPHENLADFRKVSKVDA